MEYVPCRQCQNQHHRTHAGPCESGSSYRTIPAGSLPVGNKQGIPSDDVTPPSASTGSVDDHHDRLPYTDDLIVFIAFLVSIQPDSAWDQSLLPTGTQSQFCHLRSSKGHQRIN
jgi:hypothetical protein